MRVHIIADNQFITSKGIINVLEKNLSVSTFLQATTKDDLKDKLNTHSDAVVILDYTMFDFVSMEQMLIVKTAYPKSSWILFSNELGESFLRQVLATDDTLSVVMKNDSKKQITEALKNTMEYFSYVSESVECLFQAKTEPDKLTPSERIILHEIALGKTTKEIAFEKHLSFHTVNSHRKNIFRKLEINNLHEAVRYAIRAGIFDVAEYYI